MGMFFLRFSHFVQITGDFLFTCIAHAFAETKAPYAFYFPRYFYVALIMQLCSLLSYAPYLMNTQVVNLAYVAFGVLVIIVITLVDLALTLFPGIQTRIAVVNASLKRD